MKLLPFAAAGLLALTIVFASAEEPKNGMGGMGGMNGMSGMAGKGMGGMGEEHMHYPVQSMQGSGKASSSAGPDRREVIELNAEEVSFVLGEMRNFLVSINGIVDAIAEGKPGKAAEPARRSGMHVMRNAPHTMTGKMMMEFRKLGMDTHQRFSAIAEEAAAMGDEKAILKQLSALLGNCTACHQGYRIVVK